MMIQVSKKAVHKRFVITKIGILLVSAVVLTWCLGVFSSVYAKRKSKAEIEIQRKRELRKQEKAKLNNTVWQIELVKISADKKKRKKEEDTLRFENNKVQSNKLALEGFSPTNYTINVEGDGNTIVVWETMQTNEIGNIAFWRGEIENGVMRGILSWQLSKTFKEDYGFVSTAKEDITATTKEEVPIVSEKELEEAFAVTETEEIEENKTKVKKKPTRRKKKRRKLFW